ncbi:flagellar biosynthetic protein FliO [Ralstonia sp. 22111]|uniref:flagellar biosynthetic protein FliO n=1 Tax=Ralstonia TaxID=48736 RepID=UPI003D951C22
MLHSLFSAFARTFVRRPAARLILLAVLALSGFNAAAQANGSQSLAVVGASQSSGSAEMTGQTERLPDSIPLRREAETERGAVSSVPQLLVVVAVLAALLWWLLKRFRTNAPQKNKPGIWPVRVTAHPGSGGLRVIKSSRLTSKASLHVIDWDGQQLLVGCTENGLSVLSTRPDHGAGAQGGKPEVREHD